VSTSARPQGPVTITVVRNIRNIRAARKWSAQDLTNRTGIPRSVLANLETGRRDAITVDELVAIAEAFNLSPVQLLDGTYCRQCHGAPPDGFICATCDAGRSVD
jgi:transcriptional regulator with XRE-family HTH domain